MPNPIDYYLIYWGEPNVTAQYLHWDVTRDSPVRHSFVVGKGIAMLPSTVARVSEQTSDHVNEQIRRQMEVRVAPVVAGLQAIAQHLEELDREWDIERTLETNADPLTVVGSALALFVDRRFAMIPLVASGFPCNTPSKDGVRHCKFSGGPDTAPSLRSNRNGMP